MDANLFANADWQHVTSLLPPQWRDLPAAYKLCRSMLSPRWITGSIVAVRRNEVQTNKALAWPTREKDVGAESAEDRAWARYVVVFTTAPRSGLSREMVMELHRLRWMVELQIKQDKSISVLDRRQNFRDGTIEGIHLHAPVGNGTRQGGGNFHGLL